MDKNYMVKLLREKKNSEFIEIFRNEYLEIAYEFALKKKLIKEKKELSSIMLITKIRKEYPELKGITNLLSRVLYTEMEESILIDILVSSYFEYKKALKVE